MPVRHAGARLARVPGGATEPELGALEVANLCVAVCAIGEKLCAKTFPAGPPALRDGALVAVERRIQATRVPVRIGEAVPGTCAPLMGVTAVDSHCVFQRLLAAIECVGSVVEHRFPGIGFEPFLEGGCASREDRRAGSSRSISEPLT